MSSLVLNIEMLVACSLFIAMLFFYSLRYQKPGEFSPLMMMYIATFLCCYAEIGAFAVDGNVELIWANYLFNAIYLGLINAICVLWMCYCSSLFPRPLYRNRLQLFLLTLPAIIEIVFLFTSPLTGMIYNVDSEGYYHRGRTFFLQFLPYIYFLVPSAISLFYRFRSHTTREKRKYQSLAFFTVPPLVLGSIQLMVPANSLDTLEFSIALSFLACFATSQDNLITTDLLTELPNRLSFDNLLDAAITARKRSRVEDGELYLMLGDIDGFKLVNDNNGHVEGDRALATIGRILYETASRYGAAATRFAGDEFAIIYDHSTLDKAKALGAEINSRLYEESRDCPYTLHISFGISRWNRGQTITSFLESVDSDLYRAKRLYKQSRRDEGTVL